MTKYRGVKIILDNGEKGWYHSLNKQFPLSWYRETGKERDRGLVDTLCSRTSFLPVTGKLF
ncbi:MAG: hypothetical protein GX114_07525 [Clostridiales bacterium]|jgi:hypothetical protein|nr:hypothetical protein [Clostridiales bacterium]